MSRLLVRVKMRTSGQLPHWQGVAFAGRGQITPKSALGGRFEYFDDNQGYLTGDNAGC